MQNYINALKHIMTNGVRQGNRTGIDTITVPGMMLEFDLREGFPAPTTKRLAWKQVKGELKSFLQGVTSAASFRANGCTIWDQNANEHGKDINGNFVENKWLSNPERECEDDLGRIYGAQWRDFIGHEPMGEKYGSPIHVDQIAKALHTLRTNPESRRIVVSAWNPAEIDSAALPPCHVLFQLLPHVNQKVLNMTMYMRSCDMFLGVPFNIASYALLLEHFALWSGYTAGRLTMFLADAHIYVNHFDQVQEQISRAPMKPPKLWLEHKAPDCFFVDMDIDTCIASMDVDKMHLMDYEPMAAIKAPMAV